MGRGGVMMRWRGMDGRLLGVLALLSGLIAGYGAQPAEAQVTFTQITNTTGLSANDSPSINADGTRIAFRSMYDLIGSNPDGNSEIFLWSHDAGVVQIADTVIGSNNSPAISADGTKIAFLIIGTATI